MFDPPTTTAQPPFLMSECGLTIDLDMARYCETPSADEQRFLDRLTGSLLDIGCGPGRAAAYLRECGVSALGLEVSQDLVNLARANGALCVHQCMFDPVPFEGRWDSVLLLDGNIGIGGDPAKLLERIRRIVRPAGRAFVEVNAIGPTVQLTVREHVDGLVGEQFPWALVSMAGFHELIAGSGWHCEHVHRVGDRLVVELERIS